MHAPPSPAGRELFIVKCRCPSSSLQSYHGPCEQVVQLPTGERLLKRQLLALPLDTMQVMLEKEDKLLQPPVLEKTDLESLLELIRNPNLELLLPLMPEREPELAARPFEGGFRNTQRLCCPRKRISRRRRGNPG